MDISKQIKELRKLEKQYQDSRFLITSRAFRNAADTIESLSAKLADMERKAEDCGGWILCDKNNLPDKEVLCCDQCGEMILGYVFEDETSDTGFRAENDNVYMYGCTKWMEKPKP